MYISGLDWDDNNDREIARHHVSPEEVEDVCFGQHIAKKDPSSKRHKNLGSFWLAELLMENI